MVSETEEKWRKVEAEIWDTPAEEIKEDIRGFGMSEYTVGEIHKPSDEDAVSPFTTTVRGPKRAAVKKIHNDRTERSQTVDEKYNAPITTDEEKWLENPNRYDYPGVDTVDRYNRRRRADTAAGEVKEAGMVDRIEEKGQAKNLRGKFSPRASDTYGRGEDIVRIQETAGRPDRTLAHELGHAVDYNAGETSGRYTVSSELFDPDAADGEDVEKSELEEEAIELSKKARGGFSEGGRYGASYRREYKELMADAFAMSVLQPRATKRDAPRIFDRVQEAVEEREGLDIFGREGGEDERFGFF